MARILSLILITTIVLLLFNYGGIFNESDLAASTYLFGTLGITDPQNFSASGLFLIILGLSSLITIGTISISYFTKSSIDDALKVNVKIAIVPIFGLIMWDMLIVFLKLAEISAPLAVLLFTPLFIYFIMSLIDWVMGIIS